MKRCVECKGALKMGTVDETVLIGDQPLKLRLPARCCQACGETYVAGDVAMRADLFIAGRLLDLGIATGSAFRFMRKALELRATDLAELLGVDAATVSRWETGKIGVDRATFATLAAAATERFEGRPEQTLARLRALHEGKPPSRTPRLTFDKAS